MANKILDRIIGRHYNLRIAQSFIGKMYFLPIPTQGRKGALLMKRFLLGACALSVAMLAMVSCGTGNDETQYSDTKIVGGQDVPDSQGDNRLWSTVALTTDLTPQGATEALIDQHHSFCSGTIIGPTTIVTAAHCLQKFDPNTYQKLPDFTLPKETDYLVFFGTKVDRSGHWVRARKVIPNPDWDVKNTLTPQPTSPPNDVGVILLSEPIPSTAKPATIASLDVNVQKDQDIYLVGFGVTKSRDTNDTGIMREVTTPVTSVDTAVKRLSVGAFFRGACAGDSGGPLYLKVNGEYQLSGATSAGAEVMGNCLGLVNLYTDVRYYTDWIRSVQ
jgi:secreted trypsin-like serine protease